MKSCALPIDKNPNFRDRLHLRGLFSIKTDSSIRKFGEQISFDSGVSIEVKKGKIRGWHSVPVNRLPEDLLGEFKVTKRRSTERIPH